MHKLKTQLRRLRFFAKRDFLTLQNIVDVGAIIVCCFFAWGLISSISRNWELEEKLNEHKLTAIKTQIEVEKLKLEQQYYQTDEYQELIARQKLGKMMPGETMVVLPQNSARAREKYANLGNIEVEEKSNFEQWLDLLFK